MKIGIIGAGAVGSALATHFSRLRHTVLIANSRGPESLSAVALETGASAVTISDAVAGVDLLVVAVPFRKVSELSRGLLSSLPDRSPVIDTSNYYPPRDGRVTEVDNGLAESEWVSEQLGRSVIKAFNNITARSLVHEGHPRGDRNRIALPVAGNDLRSKRAVMQLVDAIGFDAFDTGSLADSWRYQPGTPAYCPNPTLKQLPRLLQKANREQAPARRDQAARVLGKALDTLPQSDVVKIARLSAGMDLWKPTAWSAVFALLLAVIQTRKR